MPDPTGADPSFDLASAFDDHGGALFGFAVNALRDHGLAEDCVQETFLRAWRARARFDAERASLRTWLFAIERNVIIDLQRSIQRMPRIIAADALDTNRVNTTGGSTAPPADELLDRLDTIEAIAKLSDEHRDVILAVHLRGMTYAEFSDVTGVPIPTLRSRAFYALRALRASLSDEESS